MLRLRSLTVALFCLAACRPETKGTVRSTFADADPQADTIPEWLRLRAMEEKLLAGSSKVFSTFQFTDRRANSGITFVNKVVDDAGRAYKAVHYDHGMGLCAADVDGDGRSDLLFVSQRGSNGLYRNAGDGQFIDITNGSGLAAEDRIGVSCAFGDVDNDGRPDLFLTTVRKGNQLWHNEGGGRFRDITAAAGVGYVGHSSGAVFFDYNGDGLLDLFVANVGRYTSDVTGAGGYFVGLADAFHGHLHGDRAEASLLYRNDGDGRFVDVTTAAGLIETGWNADATVLDVDDDGRPDLYVPSMQGANHLWRNVDGKHFADETARWFPRTPFGAMGLKSFDFDGDGALDLYVTDMHSDMAQTYDPGDWSSKATRTPDEQMPDSLVGAHRERVFFGNALFLNRGARAYEEVAERYNAETYWPWGPSIDDLNGDGWDDIFVTASMNFPYPYAPNDLLLNTGGRRMLRAAFALGVEPRAHGVTQQQWFTVRCGPTGADRGSKACEMCEQPGAMKAGCRPSEFGAMTMMGSVGSRSSVIFDVDGDGDLDIVTNEFNAAPQLLISDLSARRTLNWLAVRLRGTRSNRQGIGARVTVVLPDGRRLVKANDGQSGYLSHSDLPLHFNFDTSTTATALEVRWPSGVKQTIQGPIRSGRTLEVVEPH
jgi:hypothetical protein